MNFLTLLSKMIVLFVFIAVGLLCEKLGLLDDHASQKLNKIVIYICAPCLIVKSVFGSTYTYEVHDILLLMLYGAVYNAIMLFLASLLTKLMRSAPEDRKTYTFLMTYNNCVFMGFPIISALFGDNALFIASVCIIPYNFFLYTVGVIFLSGKSSLRQILMSTFVNPSFFATIIALLVFFTKLSVPTPIVDIFSYLGDMVVPLSMMLIGVSLGTVAVKEILTDLRIFLIALGRLVILPLLMFLVMRLIIHDTLFRNLITVFSVMPSAAVSPIFCREYGGNYMLASKTVFLTSLLALITVPLLLSVLLV